MQRMAHRWGKKTRPGAYLLTASGPSSHKDRWAPIIMRELARKGWRTRRARNGNGHANGHANGDPAK